MLFRSARAHTGDYVEAEQDLVNFLADDGGAPANEIASARSELALVRAHDPKVGYATVYRTLKLLAECGVANERRFGDGLTRYELADDTTHHDHLICVQCGEITEFEEPRIEELQEKIARKHGFRLRTHKHELYGVCPRCQVGRRGN